MQTTEPLTEVISAKQIVIRFINALNNEDFESAKDYADDAMKFDGVLGSRDSAAAYFADMERMKFEYDVKKVFADGNDVCLLYDINMGGGTTIFTLGWYKVKDSKICSLKVVFDPRPVLEKSK
jgi:limonene-1,2-epoxide hydrolase